MRQVSTRIPKMIASRTFTSPATQCLRAASAFRPCVPAIAPIARVCEVKLALFASEDHEDHAYKAACSKNQIRHYSIPYEDKVAKFKGKKGPDVCDILIP